MPFSFERASALLILTNIEKYSKSAVKSNGIYDNITGLQFNGNVMQSENDFLPMSLV